MDWSGWLLCVATEGALCLVPGQAVLDDAVQGVRLRRPGVRRQPRFARTSARVSGVLLIGVALGMTRLELRATRVSFATCAHERR